MRLTGHEWKQGRDTGAGPAYHLRFRHLLLPPNLLSLGRIAFAWPAVKRILVHRNAEADHQAAWLLAVSFLTDGLDGIVARRFNLQTDLGKILDPVIDKLVVMSVAGSLVLSRRKPRFPISVLLAMAARDATILFLAGRSIRRYRHLFTSRWLGKITMATNAVTLLSQLFADKLPRSLVRLLPWVSFALLLLSSGDYLAMYLKVKREHPELT